MAKARVKSKTKGMTGQNRISPRAKEAILSFVDQFVPPGSTGVWLTGSRAKGSATVRPSARARCLPRCAFGTDPIQVVGGRSLPSVNLVTEFALSGRQSLSTWR
jgi:hypothetical protein